MTELSLTVSGVLGRLESCGFGLCISYAGKVLKLLVDMSAFEV